MVKKAKLKEDYAPDTSELAVIREHEIKPSDILLGYSRFSERNIGTTAFREFVYSQIPTYQEANGKSEKMYVIGTILNNVLNSGGRFLKENESREWVELDQTHAHEKVGNTLRACCTMLDVYKKLE